MLLKKLNRLSDLVKKIIQYFINFNIYDIGFAFFVLLGSLLRLRHYFGNRSLWLDESHIAISIVHRSFSDIVNNVEIFTEFAK
ncbi:MAG: hypothetical protein P9X22_08705 [Candidatus Zapsychrus exili]|nr:hypothetical protein [Candidatus Zapsychrus exili]